MIDLKQHGNVIDHDLFRNWKNDNGLQRLVLHSIKSPIVSQLAESVFNHVIDNGSSEPLCLYFGFVDFDYRQNSIEAMLYLMLARLISLTYSDDAEEGVDATPQKTLRAFKQIKWANRDDLWASFMELMLWTTSRKRDCVLVLGDLRHDITACGWFLSKINGLADNYELDLKILVTTSSTMQIHHLECWPQVDASFREEELGHRLRCDNAANVAVGTDVSVEDDLTQREARAVYRKAHAQPKETDFELLNLMQNGSGSKRGFLDVDSGVRTMVMNWYRVRELSVQDGASILQALQHCSKQPEILFRLISSSLPWPMTRPTSDILNLLLYSYRPLSIWELRDVAQYYNDDLPDRPESAKSLQYLDIICASLRVLLLIKGNEIHFAHPALRSYFLSRESPLDSSLEKIHQDIADFCLEYINTRSNQSITTYRQSNCMTYPVGWRTGFLDYAARWWPYHAQFSEAGSSYCTPRLLEVCNNASLLAHITKIYWRLHNPIARGNVEEGNYLAILASHGLSEALSRLTHQERSSGPLDDHFRRRLFESIVAAAGHGELESMLQLLEWHGLPLERLDHIILGAIRSGNPQVVIESAKLGIQFPDRIQEPSLLLSRACLAGQMTVAEMLLNLANGGQLSKDLILDMPALKHACIGARLEIIKALVKNENDSLEISDTGRSVETACKYGNAEIVGLIARDKQLDQIDIFAQVAIKFGNFSALHRILDAFGQGQIGTDKTIELLIAAIEAKYVKCWQILWNRVKYSLHPGNNSYEQVILKALWSGVPQIYNSVLELEKSLLDGRCSKILKEAIKDHDLQFQAIEAIVSTGMKQHNTDVIQAALQSALWSAVYEDRRDVVKLLIRVGTPLNRQYENGETALFRAAWHGNTEIVRMLIESGADKEIPDSSGWRPLHAACSSTENTRILIQSGADINAKTESGHTSLYLASNDDLDTIETILEAKETISMVTMQEALIVALSSGKLNSVRRLLEAGADTSTLLSEGPEVLMDAVRIQNVAMVKLLLEYRIDLEKARDSDLNSVLNKAVSNHSGKADDDTIMKALVNRGSDLSTSNYYHYTPLYTAAISDKVKVARYLLSKGAKINIKGGDEGGPLILACFKASLEMVKLLCEHGADTNITDQGLCGTPLQAALLRAPSQEKGRILKYLLEDVDSRVDVNLKSMKWGGPLNVAALNGTLDDMELLLEHGVKVISMDDLGREVIHFALHRDIEQVEYLRQLGQGVDLFVNDNMGRGALHFAVLSGRLDLVQYVIKEAQNTGKKIKELVNAEDSDKWTPLHWAVREVRSHWQPEVDQRLDILKELLHHGAELFAVGLGLDRDWTVLKLAKHYSLSLDVIDFLNSKRDNIAHSRRENWDIYSRNARKAIVHDPEWYCDTCLTVSTFQFDT